MKSADKTEKRIYQNITASIIFNRTNPAQTHTSIKKEKSYFVESASETLIIEIQSKNLEVRTPANRILYDTGHRGLRGLGVGCIETLFCVSLTFSYKK